MRTQKISYSQYSMWKNCPYQWLLNYHGGEKVESNSIHTIFGTAVHHAIQEWLQYLYSENNTIEEPSMPILFKNKLKQLFIEKTIHQEDGASIFLCDKPTYIEFYHEGIKILNHILENFTKYFPTKNWKLVGCEVPLNIDLTDSVFFVAYLDIVLSNILTGEVKILDLKTSGKGWFYEKTDDKKINQLLLYKKYYAQQFNISEDLVEVVFVILSRKAPSRNIAENFVPRQGPNRVQLAVNDMMDFVNAAFDSHGNLVGDNIKSTPSSSSCKFCPFRDNKTKCPDGISS